MLLIVALLCCSDAPFLSLPLVLVSHYPLRGALTAALGSKQACGIETASSNERELPTLLPWGWRKFPVWEEQRKPLSPLHEAGDIHAVALSPWGMSPGPRVVRGHLGSTTARTGTLNLKLSFLGIISCVET